MADESLGTARIDVVVDTASMDVAIERAKSRLSSMSADAQKAYAGMNAAEKRRIDSLLKQADTLGFTRQQQILYNAALKGAPVAILDELKAKMGGVSTATAQAATAATKAFSGTGKSARELQFAMRGLPAQFTDIFTSLASGQRPMMVLLQQGGQVKDMFGGVAPALRAVGSGILAMINPLTIGVAAAAALAFAWKEGSDEAVAYNKALITTGNYAGVTATHLAEMASELDNVSGVTQHSAAEVLAAVVATGKFTGDEVKQVAQAALEMQRTTGQAIDKTIQSFADLAKSPVDGILKLNDAQHFLTESQYEAIKALQDHGREQEAFALAVKTATESVNGRMKSVDDNLGALESTLRSAKDLWHEFWDAALDVGRKETPALKIKQLEQNIQGVQEGNGVYQGLSEAQKTRIIAGMRAKIAQQKQLDFSNVQGGVVGDPVVNSDQKRAQDEWQQAGLKYATDRDRMEHDITEARKAGNKAGESDVAIEQRIQAIRASYADKAKGKGTSAKETPSFRVDDMRQIEAEIAAEGKLHDERDRSAEAVKAYQASLADMLDTRQRAIDLQVASLGMGQREVEQQQALIGINEDYNRKKAALERQQRNTSSAILKASYQQQLDDLAQYHDDRVRMEVDGWRREADARKDASLGARKAILDFEDAGGDVAGQTREVFTNAFDGMADSLAKFVTTGKGSFSDLAESIIADLAKMEARILVSQALQSIFGGMGTAAGYNSASPSQQVAFDVAHGSANGNVFNTPSLSAYSNTIVDKPTFFAKGGNVMGEAGPEAILPLTRGTNGKLGVQASGGGDGIEVQINITNNGQAVQAQQTGQRMDGKKMMIDLVLQTVQSDIAKGGGTAQAMQQRFGLSRRGVPVGGA